MEQIQKQILEILNEFNDENPGYYAARIHLIDKLKIDDKTLEKNVLYLHKEKYVDIASGLGVSFNSVKITDKGIAVVESPEINVQDSQNIVTTSNDITIRIENGFNEIYNAIEALNLENKNEIRHKVNIIQEELKKDKISKSKINNSTKWLKKNARWTILPLAQIIMKSYGLSL